MPWSYTYLATQRMPLPHISASLPSALNICIRASATSTGPNQNQTVAPDPKVTMRHLASQLRQIAR